ncbi:hypothetical protein [Terrabacter sp. MAHUQ-38]|uniref:hypothetical protein n=1 Tax=unclassified Terrabacter TaxID=2630222 RepID=UPI00165D3FA6|nr:hypothetical protein [Terrabacter sp. MAHUQ-38]MBC9822864.1 hypothetical protein [Terrabacter sp. MAHUQ-38]
MKHPVDTNARQRLLAAQRAEAEALRAVETASRAQDRVASRLADANTKLSEARQKLVSTSGHARAALLLGMDESALRRDLRRLEHAAPETDAPPSS